MQRIFRIDLRSPFKAHARATVEGLLVFGTNDAPKEISSRGTYFSSNIKDYLDPGVSNSRYAPYIGFAVDPYTAYPGNSQGYMNDPYGRSTTSTVYIVDCRIDKFAVGFGVSLSEDNSLGDEIVLERCHIANTVTALTSGGSQNRVLAFNNGYISACHTAVDNSTYGMTRGNTFNLDSCVIVLCYQWLKLISGNDPSVMSHIHIEQFNTMGSFWGSSIGTAIKFNDCHIKFFCEVAPKLHHPASILKHVVAAQLFSIILKSGRSLKMLAFGKAALTLRGVSPRGLCLRTAPAFT